MRKRKLQRINQNKYDIFEDCDVLKAWRFFHILDTLDYRFLLDFHGTKPPEYDLLLLRPVWDRICDQYDEIKGQQVFHQNVEDLYEKIDDYIKLIIMRASYVLMSCGDESAIKHLRYVNVKFAGASPEVMLRLRTMIMRIETKLNIERIENHVERNKESSEYIRSMVAISNILGRTIDPYIISVTEYIILENEAKEIIKARTKHNGTGYQV